MGVAMNLNPFLLWLTCVIGNILPVPFILLCIRSIFEWMKKREGFLQRIVVKMEQKADKGAQMIYKYELLGLFLLVAVPLPGTGAWTGALVAAMLRMRMKSSILMITFGVCTAGIIMLMLSCGVDMVLAI